MNTCPVAETLSERHPLLILHDVARLIRTRADQLARARGMTRAQWVILRKLQSQPGLSQNDLADLVEVEPITVARLVDRLEARGLVERRADPKDRRIRRLHLTEAAAPILEEIGDSIALLTATITEGIDPKTMEMVVDCLMQGESEFVCGLAFRGARSGVMNAMSRETDLSAPVQPLARMNKATVRRVLMIGGVAAVLLVSLGLWLSGGRYITSDDSYVRSPKLMVSTDVSGTVSEVDVREGQMVHQGDVLFRLDQRPFIIALASAKSELAQTVLDVESMKHDYQRMQGDVAAQAAQRNLAQTTAARQDALWAHQATAKETVEQSKAALNAASATLGALQQQASTQLAKLGGNLNIPVEQQPQYMSAKAKVDEAQRQLDHSIVRAPFDGIVTQVGSLQPGAVIISAMAAFMPTSAVGLVGTKNLWVDANLKETDLTYVHPGQPVDIRVDTYPDRVWHGTVGTIAPATGGEFSVLPAQNSSGNWVKVVQRVPVHIDLDRAQDDPVLRSGMSVDISIDTNHHRSLSDLF